MNRDLCVTTTKQHDYSSIFDFMSMRVVGNFIGGYDGSCAKELSNIDE